MPACIAIIPARGGSKRLPRKNILPFKGKPLLLWTCEAAKASGCFDRIIVSSDDPEIADIAGHAGYEVDVRPAHLGTDTASCADVCLELLDRLEATGSVYDQLCCLYATAPLRTAQDIRQVMALMGPETDAAYAICTYSHPPVQMLFEDKDGFLQSAFPLLINKKSQEIPLPLIDNGSTYVITARALRKYHTFHPPKIKGHRMPFLRSIDIDTAEDFALLEACAQLLEKEGYRHDI